MVEEALEGFRRSGVDRDAATRQKIRTLQSDITAPGMSLTKTFEKTSVLSKWTQANWRDYRKIISTHIRQMTLD
jgi:hypothetical protein